MIFNFFNSISIEPSKNHIINMNTREKVDEKNSNKGVEFYAHIRVCVHINISFHL